MNYKRLGNFIEPINIRNTELEVTTLLGVSIKKVLMPSIANTIGTNMKTYKIIEKNQFAYGPVTSRNGDKISIALLEDYDKAIVSQAYTVFKVIDEQEVIPQYLMMWFRRPEFDRYARFKSHGSAREVFDWEEFCDTQLPIPSIEKQRQIVAEYNTVTQSIHLNKKINTNLEATAQALYKHWFVDFNFPITEESCPELASGSPHLIGKPYKSSGGEMVYNEELDKDIPVGWSSTTLGKLLSKKGYIRGPFGSALKKSDMQKKGIPVYEQQHAIYNHREFRYFITKEKYEKLKRFSIEPDDLVISCSGTLGRITLINKEDKIGVINQALLILRTDKEIMEGIYLKCFLDSKKGNMMLLDGSGGSAQVNIAKREIIQSIPYALANNTLIEKFTYKLKIIQFKIDKNVEQSKKLKELQSLLLAKMTQVATKPASV
ncbi:restriction endonuclease subunit S [uncultured Tenacibaculum sp.]|uniref:restriction endonuclease subunit S n=1 Tax=uncultured Tenacibaculum sp. TaxID=174713 RepID=UPI0026066C19|nr:restriction endonuclease subunit S [uncultured Tenacibaculum sp.]